jgi:integrase
MENKPIKELIETALVQLEDFGMTNKTIRSYNCMAFHTIELYFSKKSIAFYDDELMSKLKKLYQSQFNAGKISSKTYNWRLRGIGIITEVYQTGCFKWRVFSKKQKKLFLGFFEATINGFLQSLGDLKRKSIYESVTRQFIDYLIRHGYDSFAFLTGSIIKNFMLEISADRPKSMDDVITILRRLFFYLDKNGIVKYSLYSILAAPRLRDRKTYPSIKVAEFNNIVSCIDLDSPSGKRDYAIFMLAATTGLRSGDIASLKLSHINWRSNELCFVQGKTQEILRLPLDKITGSAIADYILNERPTSTSENIFLRSCAPYEGFHDGVSISCIFRKYLKKAGITHKNGDGKTMHGIRRMLGTEMTVAGIPVTTVSHVLGHKNMDSAKQYISLDIQGLKKCALGFNSLGGAPE